MKRKKNFKKKGKNTKHSKLSLFQKSDIKLSRSFTELSAILMNFFSHVFTFDSK